MENMEEEATAVKQRLCILDVSGLKLDRVTPYFNVHPSVYVVQKKNSRQVMIIFPYHLTQHNLRSWNTVIKYPNSQPITFITVLLLLQTPVWFGRGSHLAHGCKMDITDS
jgi:hypothetical protein